jgi:hypothetical protein
MYRCRVHGYFVGARLQHASHIAYRTQAAPDAKRDEYLLGYLFDHVDHGVSGLGSCPDIQENQLIGPFLIIKGGQLDRVSRVAKVGKTRAFDYTSFSHIQTGYNAFS